MATSEFQKVFESFKRTLQEKLPYHQDQRSVYEGKLAAKTLGIALDADLEKRINAQVDYARIAVDNLAARQKFDAFRNDELGFTRLLVRSNALPAIGSAILNSQISSCAAVSIIPQDISKGELPIFTAYTGAEFTGRFNARNGALRDGMVINEKDSLGTPLNYLFFAPGWVVKVDASGKVLQEVAMPTKRLLLVPFVYGQDLAVRPFGESRLNRAAISALKSVIVINMLLAASREHRVGNAYMLILDKAYSSGIIGETERTELTSKMGTINTVSTPADAKLVQMAGVPTDELQKLKSFYLSELAIACGMSDTIFGIKPANGSASEGAMAEQNRPYNAILDNCRDSYGDSIKELALAAMGCLTPEDPDWSDISPVWQEPANLNLFGAISDGVGKLSASNPNWDSTEFIRKNLGESIREQALQVRFPNFSVSQEIAAKYKALEQSQVNSDGGSDILSNGL
jgi:hypothetical protein